MKNYKQELLNTINNTYGNNAQYIINAMEHELHMFDFYAKREDGQDQQFMDFVLQHDIEKAEDLNGRLLTPATAKVGEGATINLWSDSHACTIIKVTKCTITVQRDKATLDPNFKPEWIEGGFVGHCTNQNKQSYTYERDYEGDIETFRWSNKYNQYGTPNNPRLSKGRHEFYDYNF